MDCRRRWGSERGARGAEQAQSQSRLEARHCEDTKKKAKE
jgi:hypothetical protein